MGTVFITQQPRPNRLGWLPNLSPASQFGKFVYVFTAADAPWTNPDAAMEKATDLLRDFNEDEDFVLWPNSGDPAAMWIILAILARFPLRKIRILYWERKLENGERMKGDGFYTPVTINLPI